jgi:O-antigen/teichoic acid export membrane protein
VALERTYKKSILKSLSWSTLSKLSRQGIQLIFIFILARLLTPAEYGIMAMVMSFSMLAEILRDMGTGAAIIQKTDTSEDLFNTAFCFNIIVGILVYIAFYFTAPLIAAFFKQPSLVPLLRTFALIYIIGSMNIVQEAILQKNLEFRRLFFIDVISVTVSGVAAIFMAINNWGVWSLVYQHILMIVIATIVLWATSSWRPRLKFKWTIFKEIKHYSFYLFSYNVVYFFGRETDKFLIGKFIGAQALGIYQRAYMLMLLPINQINLIISRVMFPVFSSLKSDIAAMRNLYVQAITMIAFFTFPMMAMIFVLAEPLITIILGQNWIEVAFYLKIFVIYSMIESVGVTTAWIYKSLGHTRVMLKWGIFGAAVVILSAITGMQWGSKGIAISYVIAQLTILWLPGWAIAFKFIDLKIGPVLKKLLPIFINTVTMAIVGSLLYHYFRERIGALAICVLVLFACIPIYILLSTLTKQKGAVILGKFVKTRLKKLAQHP